MSQPIETGPSFDEMVSTLGEETDSFSLPEPGPIDPSRVAEVWLIKR